ncbi:histidine phosphotransferase family protein [Alteriqipengyuania lutimaris]|uniref:Histidine phosphotransferase n=1 Tax=Alteriqipengyuania lutimaris TaxID=1538146 RepID=A0A395LLB8_9SPHN|nr:histidine phosphotransferase family protein [Alteriqipengyuania lutimaris]MBB3033498.1 histidine phosphotransferase ChpT [Alteriqipengyuania lutimaris]RDS77489.1 histidine phosphotransferase [Alteriqipengyuania lutimaris]
MSETDPLLLASQLCSRLCHDMLSPVGALSNGLELLADEKDPQMRQRCFELLEQSARTSAAKLKFFRLAYGAGGGFGEQISIDEPKAVIETLAADAKRIELNWQLTAPTLSKTGAKVMLNLAHIGLDALVRGGTLDIGAEDRDDVTEIVVRATGTKIAFDAQVGEALGGKLDPEDLTGRTAPAHVLAVMAERSGGVIQTHADTGTLLLGATLPHAE